MVVKGGYGEVDTSYVRTNSIALSQQCIVGNAMTDYYNSNLRNRLPLGYEYNYDTAIRVESHVSKLYDFIGNTSMTLIAHYH